MDVILLSRMIGELMPGLDSLSLPGLGTFTAEQVSASFSDKGYTINPPYRRLGFSSTQTDDGQLAGLYATSNGVSPEEADAIIRAFTGTLGKELSSRSSIEFPGLGRLRSTREGHLFFVPDEDLDISPEACGLTTVSLKFHSVTTDVGKVLATVKKEFDEEIKDQGYDQYAVGIGKDAPKFGTGTGDNGSNAPEAGTKAVDNGREASEAGKGSEGIGPYELTFEPFPDGDAVGRSNQGDVKKNNRSSNPQRKPSKAFYYVAVPVLAAAIIIGGFAALSRLAPAFTDKLLYTPEQLAIINAPEHGIDISR